MDERDLLALEMGKDVAAGDLALLVIAPAGAEDVPHVALGDFGIGRGWRDRENPVFLIDFRSRNGDAGIVVADDEFHAVTGKVVGDRNALFWIGDVVAELDGHLVAKDAPGGIDVGGSLFDAVLHLRAGRGVRASERAADPEFHLGGGGLRERKRKAQRDAERGDPLHL